MEQELYHYGVLGMKWGIRRYQNKDGSLTAAGRKRYSSERAKTIHDIENGAADYSTYKDKVKAVSKDCLSFSANYGYIVERAKKDPAIKARVNDAARLGLKAYGEFSPGDQEWVNDLAEDFRNWRDWFLFEDQTFGMGLICDLINQGYSADQCKKLIDIVEKGNEYNRESYDKIPRDDKTYELAAYTVFDITEGNYDNYLKAWADTVEKVKKQG